MVFGIKIAPDGRRHCPPSIRTSLATTIPSSASSIEITLDLVI
jgi:hypothetical protein